MTFEHRHENKSCSACREREVFQVFQNIPGSQLLSDIQTFLAWIQLYELKSVSHAGCHNFSLVTCEDEVIKQNHLRISPINSDNQ